MLKELFTKILVALGLATATTLSMFNTSAYKISVYYPDWKYYKGYSIDKIDYAKIDILNYAFFEINSDLQLKPVDPYSFEKNYPLLEKIKKQKPSLIATIAIGGYNNSQGFSKLTGDNLNIFVNSVNNFIKNHPAFNGVVIDWEFPVCFGGKEQDKYTLLNLVKALKQKGLYVAVALSANPECQNNLLLKDMIPYVDYFELMGYDIYGPWNKTIAPNSPLNWNGLDVQKSVENLLKYVPSNKILLGVPFYGRSYVGNNLHLGSTFTGKGPGSSEAGYISYKDITTKYQNLPYYFDEFSKTPYRLNNEKTLLITYENTESLKYKLNLIKQKKLAGTMIWEITQDNNKLLPFIYNTLHNKSQDRAQEENDNQSTKTSTPTHTTTNQNNKPDANNILITVQPENTTTNLQNEPTPRSETKLITIQYPRDGKWPNYKDNNYALEINPWNITNANGQITMTYEPNAKQITLDYDLTNINVSNPGAYVHSYPEIFIGNKPWNSTMVRTDLLPAKFSTLALKLYTISANYILKNENNAPLNLAFETWLTHDKFRTTGIKSDEVEIMIWFYSNKLNPAGSKIGEFTTKININGTDKQVTFEVYKGYIGWHYIGFRLKTSITEADIKFSLNDFLLQVPKYLNTNLDNLYIEVVELGTESGSPQTSKVKYSWTIKNFELTIQSTGSTITPKPTTITPTPTTTPSPTIQPTTTPTPKPTITTTPTPLPTSFTYLPTTMHITSEWGQGFCAKVTIKNNTNKTVKWQAKLNKEYAYKITSNWNSNLIKETSKELTFIGQDYNKILAPQNSTNFGFCAEFLPPEKQALTEIPNNLKITSSWDTGFCAEVIVKNTYNKGIFWKTKIKKYTLTSTWNTKCKLKDDSYVCTGDNWNAYLPQGQETSFGFCAEK